MSRMKYLHCMAKLFREVTVSSIIPGAIALSFSVAHAETASTPMISRVVSSEGSSGYVTLQVSGSNFTALSVVEVDGSSLTTTYASPSSLSAVLPERLPAGALLPLQVSNGGKANSAPYTVNIPPSLEAATRLLDQATFGPNISTIEQVRSLGLAGFIHQQLSTPPSLLPALPANTSLPSRCTMNAALCNDENWWQIVMTGNDQLRQRVAFALSEIFVISYDEMPAQAFPFYLNTLAKDAFANWSTIMRDVTLSPAMGFYLNMANSKKAYASADANENFARENMQLFNLGLNQLHPDGSLALDAGGNSIPTYSQAQVEAFARAFTGWTYPLANGTAPSNYPNWATNFSVPMVAVASAHDSTEKVLLNATLPAGQSPEEDLDGAVHDIFMQSSLPPFICKQLIKHLVTGNPSPGYVQRIAAVFIDNGHSVRGDMGAVIEAILLDPEARAGDVSATGTGDHLREPVLWTANVMRGLEAVPAPGVTDASAYYPLDDYSSMIGQTVFRAPSVFSYFAPNYVVPGTNVQGPEFALETTATTLLRLNAANSIAANLGRGLMVDLSAASPLGLLAAQSNDALLDELGKRFMHNQMPADMRAVITALIAPVPDTARRVRMAVYLVITSSQYKIMH